MRIHQLGLGVILSGCAAHGVDPTSDNGTIGDPGKGGMVGPGGGSSGPTVLYAHSNTTLYRLDADNLTVPVQPIGDFDCVGSNKAATSMTDLAVGKDGSLYGVSEIAAYPLILGQGTVHCSAVWTLPPNSKFYGLTMAPENTVDTSETLIAADGLGQLYRIDSSTGNATEVGTLGSDPITGRTWSLSGDIVFLANGGSPLGFATVRTCTSASTSSCTQVDTVIEVDVSKIHPGTQSVLKSIRGPARNGSLMFGSMYGIVAYHDKVIGFSTKGDVVVISNVDGSASLVSTNPNVHFAGAGVSTLAPVVAPPK